MNGILLVMIQFIILIRLVCLKMNKKKTFREIAM